MSETIVALAETVAWQLRELSALEAARADAADIRSAYEALIEVAPDIKLTAETFRHLCDRLSPEGAEAVRQDLALLAQSVRASHDAFARDRRQAHQLRGLVRAQARKALATLTDAWRTAAEARLRPSLQLLTLVERLPEMHGQSGVAAQLRTRLLEQAARLPRRGSQLADFDRDCEALEGTLQDMQGLSAPIKSFLARVAEKRATIDDLTDEALAWCRKGSRPGAFRIVFPEEGE